MPNKVIGRIYSLLFKQTSHIQLLNLLREYKDKYNVIWDVAN